jgi:hypothetical protein
MGGAGEGGGGCFLFSPEDLLNKSSLKITFLWKTPETNNFAWIFARYFLF